jgi:hypothetical protein
MLMVGALLQRAVGGGVWGLAEQGVAVATMRLQLFVVCRIACMFYSELEAEVGKGWLSRIACMPFCIACMSILQWA